MNNSLKIGILALSLLTVATPGHATTHRAVTTAPKVHTEHKKSKHSDTFKKIHHISHRKKRHAHAIAGDNMHGIASWYGYESGPRYRRRPRTANGEYFSPKEFTAAHKSLPFGTLVNVTNLSNNKTVVVRINDRGPFVKGRIIDLAKAAANAIGLSGIGRVSLTVNDDSNKYNAKITTL